MIVRPCPWREGDWIRRECLLLFASPTKHTIYIDMFCLWDGAFRCQAKATSYVLRCVLLLLFFNFLMFWPDCSATAGWIFTNFSKLLSTKRQVLFIRRRLSLLSEGDVFCFTMRSVVVIFILFYFFMFWRECPAKYTVSYRSNGWMDFHQIFTNIRLCVVSRWWHV